VITYNVFVDEATGRVYLLTIYDKKERTNITSNEIASLIDELG